MAPSTSPFSFRNLFRKSLDQTPNETFTRCQRLTSRPLTNHQCPKTLPGEDSCDRHPSLRSSSPYFDLVSVSTKCERTSSSFLDQQSTRANEGPGVPECRNRRGDPGRKGDTPPRPRSTPGSVLESTTTRSTKPRCPGTATIPDQSQDADSSRFLATDGRQQALHLPRRSQETQRLER